MHRKNPKEAIFDFSVRQSGSSPDGHLLCSPSTHTTTLSSYRGMSTPAASQAAMTLAPLGMVTVFPLTVHSIPSTTGAAAAGAGAGVEASERAKKKSMPPLLSLPLLLVALMLLLLPLVLAAAPPSARAAARRAAARAARNILKVKEDGFFSFSFFLPSSKKGVKE